MKVYENRNIYLQHNFVISSLIQTKCQSKWLQKSQTVIQQAKTSPNLRFCFLKKRSSQEFIRRILVRKEKENKSWLKQQHHDLNHNKLFGNPPFKVRFRPILSLEPKLYIPSTYYKDLKKGSHQRHLGTQKMGWFLAD